MNRLFQTTSFRLTTLYACMFVLSMGLLFGIVYWVTTDVLYEQTRIILQNEMNTLNPGSEKKSEIELVADIEKRLKRVKSRTIYFSLIDMSGRQVAGNLPSLEKKQGLYELTIPEQNTGMIQLVDDGGDSQDSEIVVLALGKALNNGSFLSVAVDLGRTQEAKEAIIRSFAWASGVGLLLAIVSGVLLSSELLRRVDEINRMTRAIVSGNMSDRIRIGESGDELDQLGANLNEMLDRLQALMEGLKQVSNDIAHDLRTPLSRLKQRLEAVCNESDSKQAYVLAVDEALQDANAALSIFSALLRIAQIDSRVRQTNFIETSLSDIVTSLSMTYMAVAEDMGKELISKIKPDLTVNGDLELLTQMLVNLIENALTHTPDNATVCLCLSQQNNAVCIEVSDNGHGISYEERKKIFDRFYRCESSRTSPGNGLGLALVKAVVELHGAKIHVLDNNPGATFKICFNDRPN